MIRPFLRITTLLFFISGMCIAQTPNSWRGLGAFPDWPFPYNRHEHAAIALNGKFYVIGGRGNKPVQVYDPQQNSWQDQAEPPLEMHHFQLVGVNGLIYVVGGFTGNFPHETPLSHVYVYDPLANSWQQGPAIPAGRRRGSAGAVVYNDKIYVISGIVDGHSSGWVTYTDVFDPATGSWTPLADAPRARDHFHAALVGQKIYVAGGRRSGADGTFNATVAEVDVYDIPSNSWTTLSQPIPTQRAGCTAAAVGQEVLIIGGESGQQQAAHVEVEALHTQNGSWRRLADLNLGRHGMQALLYQNEVYVIGGSQEKGANEIGRESPYFMEAYTPDVQTARPPTGATQGLRLFPNPAPAGGRLSLSWLQADTGTYEVHLSLLDMRGRQLWQQQVTAASLNAGLWIQLPQKLAAGTYLLQLSSQRQHWAAKLRIR